MEVSGEPHRGQRGNILEDFNWCNWSILMTHNGV